MVRCNICGRKVNGENLIAHIKRQHAGKLTRESIDYLLSLGIGIRKIVEFARQEGIEIEVDD